MKKRRKIFAKTRHYDIVSSPFVRRVEARLPLLLPGIDRLEAPGDFLRSSPRGGTAPRESEFRARATRALLAARARLTSLPPSTLHGDRLRALRPGPLRRGGHLPGGHPGGRGGVRVHQARRPRVEAERATRQPHRVFQGAGRDLRLGVQEALPRREAPLPLPRHDPPHHGEGASRVLSFATRRGGVLKRRLESLEALPKTVE